MSIQHEWTFQVIDYKLQIRDGTRLDNIYAKFQKSPDSFLYKKAHINIMSAFYDTVKVNHFANAPVNTLEQETENFHV